VTARLERSEAVRVLTFLARDPQADVWCLLAGARPADLSRALEAARGPVVTQPHAVRLARAVLALRDAYHDTPGAYCDGTEIAIHEFLEFSLVQLIGFVEEMEESEATHHRAGPT
jgi:hypothetical protein